MNVGELKKMLEKYPDDMDVITNRYRDNIFEIIHEDEWSVIDGWESKNEIIPSSITWKTAGDQLKEKSYLYLYGG